LARQFLRNSRWSVCHRAVVHHQHGRAVVQVRNSECGIRSYSALRILTTR
jgi:hypothetical protein